MITVWFFFFNDTATTEIYTLSLHDALPISSLRALRAFAEVCRAGGVAPAARALGVSPSAVSHLVHELERTLGVALRSEEHTSELQSRQYLVCRLLLEKKKK